MDVKSMYEKFAKYNYYSRVDNSHILELHIGLDDKGRKSIELRDKFNPRKVTGTVAIEVNQFKKPEYNTIRFSLAEEEVSGLYYTFCDDLIETTRGLKDKNEGYNAIINRFYQWKKLFVSSKGNILTEPQIMGLIGEILYLRGTLADKIGLSAALKSWSGQELTHKDFSYGNSWTEVKTVGSGGTTVKISSLEQLESNTPGELAVYILEKMSSSYKGITLNKLIMETRNLFAANDDREDFLSKVALQGYEYNDVYDEYVYEIRSYNRYIVTEGFPRLVPNMVMPAIKKATYEISIAELKDYLVQEE